MRLLSACAAAVLGGFALAGASCADRLACVRELQRQVEAAGGYAEAAAQEVQGAFYAGGELGMVAKGFVAEGDMVLSVSVEAIVMPPTCEDGFDPDRDDAVLYLTRCLLKTSNPLFKQYLAALPEETANLYAYTEDELAEFQTTSLRDMINLKKDAVSRLLRRLDCKRKLRGLTEMIAGRDGRDGRDGLAADEGGVREHDGPAGVVRRAVRGVFQGCRSPSHDSRQDRDATRRL